MAIGMILKVKIDNGALDIFMTKKLLDDKKVDTLF